MGRVHYTSVTRIADRPGWPLPHEALPAGEWRAGDYVVGAVLPFEGHVEEAELATGRVIEVLPGDLMVGAFGRRYATLEATGSFEGIEDDLLMHSLSGGGCFGRVTSKAPFSPDLVPLEYVGHILADGSRLNMHDVVPDPPDRSFDLPSWTRPAHHRVSTRRVPTGHDEAAAADRRDGLEALNLMDRGNHRRLRTPLADALGGVEPPDA